MKPVIKSYDCSDHDPIESWEPVDRTDVDFWVNFTIGMDRSGGDNFQVRVVTPGNLRGGSAGKYAIIVNYYDWPSVLFEVQNILNACQGDDWREISGKLAKHMRWEYEDYKP